MPDFALGRERMVEAQLGRRGIRDPCVLDAMHQAPREAFVASELRDIAYEDCPVSIGEGQTISQPYIVALMAEAAELKSTDSVLEVGTGSGYAAAVLSRIASGVYGIECFASLIGEARARHARLGYENVELRCSDGTLGWPEAAPFDAILVAASADAVPPPLKDQLASHGRLLMPVNVRGQLFRQTLRKLRRLNVKEYEESDLGPVTFVPLVGGKEEDASWGSRRPRG